MKAFCNYHSSKYLLKPYSNARGPMGNLISDKMEKRKEEKHGAVFCYAASTICKCCTSKYSLQHRNDSAEGGLLFQPH